MLEITNQTKFKQIISDAICATAETAKNERSAARWINAINKAADLVETQGEFITRNEADKSVLVWNQESNKIYEANGVCQCAAYKSGMACKHRALAKLLRKYFAPEQAAEMSKAPYLPSSSTKAPITVGRYRI
jgi:hypothetical protein